MKFSTLVLAGLCSLVAPPAWAHIELLAPTPRIPNNDSIKVTPCGPGARNNARVSTFAPGETITLEWQETISHPGYYRVLLDEDGQNDLPKPTTASFQVHHDYYNKRNNVTIDKLPAPVEGPIKEANTWVLSDYWGQHPSGAARKWMLKVKLPNVTCTNCTLQLLQSMYESGRNYNNAYYYHCADLIIKGEPSNSVDAGTPPSADAGAPGNEGGSGGQTASGGSGSGQAGGNSNEGGNGNEGGEGGSSNTDDDADEGDQPSKSKGGCSMATGSAGFTAFWLLALGTLLVRRKRR